MSNAQSDFVDKIYKIRLKTRISKKLGGDRTEIATQIRAIDGVTIVSIEEGSQQSEPNYWYQNMNIKFCCAAYINISPNLYIKNVLSPNIGKIKGLDIVKVLDRPHRIV